MFTDTHCHLHLNPLVGRLPEILADAARVNVSAMIVPAVAYQDWQAALALQQYSQVRAVAVGVHPWFVQANMEDEWVELAAILTANTQVWVGEIGLDFYDKSLSEEQKQLQIDGFEQQLLLAQKFQRPVIIHHVRAVSQVVASIKKVGFQYGGIAHAFSGSLESATELIACGLKIGLGSLLLNPKVKKIRETVKRLPESSILLETDSPFMSSDLGNTPSKLHTIAQEVALIRGISIQQLAEVCEENLQQLVCNSLPNLSA